MSLIKSAMQLAETNEEISVPQMINLEALTKILLAFSKAGGDKIAVSIEEVAQISGVNQNNVSLNNKFFVSMGLVEGKRGSYKLTTAGSEYTKALDWGRLEEAQSILRKTIKDNPFVQKTVSYVDLNKPVSKDDLIGKIAGFAGVSNEPRFSTGIKAFVEMLSLSGILKENKDGMLISGLREEPKVTVFPDNVVPDQSIVQKRDLGEKGQLNESESKQQRVIVPSNLPISVSLNIDSNSDPEKLKLIIKAIREAFGSEVK